MYCVCIQNKYLFLKFIFNKTIKQYINLSPTILLV